jgi:hypothetical protein
MRPADSHLVVLGAGGPSPWKAPPRFSRARGTAGAMLLAAGLALFGWDTPRKAAPALAGGMAAAGAAVLAGRRKRRGGELDALPLIMFGRRGHGL